MITEDKIPIVVKDMNENGSIYTNVLPVLLNRRNKKFVSILFVGLGYYNVIDPENPVKILTNPEITNILL